MEHLNILFCSSNDEGVSDSGRKEEEREMHLLQKKRKLFLFKSTTKDS